MASMKHAGFTVSCEFKVSCNKEKFQEVEKEFMKLNEKAEFFKDINQDVYLIKSSSLSKDLILKMFDMFESHELSFDNASSNDCHEESCNNSKPSQPTNGDMENKIPEDKMSNSTLHDKKEVECDQARAKNGIRTNEYEKGKDKIDPIMPKKSSTTFSVEEIEGDADSQPNEFEEKELVGKQSKARNSKGKPEMSGRDTYDKEGDDKHQNHAGSKSEKSNKKEPDEDKLRGRDNDEQDNDDLHDHDDGEQNKGITSILFSKAEYDLALKLFKKSRSSQFLSKPSISSKSMVTVRVDDHECRNELIHFKKNVNKVDISRDKYDDSFIRNFQKSMKKYESKIIMELDTDCFSITALKDIHEAIRNEFPGLFQKETSFSLSAGSNPGSNPGTDIDDRENGPYNSDGELPSGSALKQRSTENCREPKNVDRFQGHRLLVKVLKTDITKLDVDVIVNAANGSLKHGGGVAKAIADAAGPKLKDECRDHLFIANEKKRICVSYHFASSGGKLKAKQVFHAVGPRWSDYSESSSSRKECKTLLRHTILRCLLHAEKEGFTSIAFPSISAAIFRVPRDICLESYLKAVKHFEKLRGDRLTKLQTIYFVDIADDMVEDIKKFFTRNWEITLDTTDPEFRSDREIINDGYNKRESQEYGSFPQRNYGDRDSSGIDHPTARHGSFSQRNYGGRDLSRDLSGIDQTGHRSSPPPSYAFSSENRSTDLYPVLGHRSSPPPSYSLTVSSGNRSTDLYPGHRSSPSPSYAMTVSSGNKSTDHHAVNYLSSSSSQSKTASSKSKSTSPPGRMTGNMPVGMMTVQIMTDDHQRQFAAIKYTFHSPSMTLNVNIPLTREVNLHELLYLLMLAFHRKLTYRMDVSTSTGIQWKYIHETASANNPYDPKYAQLLLKELQSIGVCHENITHDERREIDYQVKTLSRTGCMSMYSNRK